MALDDDRLLDSDLEADVKQDAVNQAQAKIDQLERARAAWNRLHSSDWGRLILTELEAFCAPAKSQIRSTPELTYAQLGRHEVWLFAQERINMTDDDILRMIGRSKP
jgi:hypothetical protein